MKKYWIKVTRNNQAKIISLYSPDLKVELLDKHNDHDHEDVSDFYRKYVVNTLTNYLRDGGTQIVPKKLKQLKSFSLTNLQHWEAFEINLKGKCSFFAKTLPVFGQVSNAIAIFTGAFVTFMALQITISSSNNDDEENSSSIALSITGTILISIVAFILYIYSGASEVLESIGDKLDNFFCRRRRGNHEVLSERRIDGNETLFASKKSKAYCQNISWPLVGVSTIAVGCIAANAVIVGIKQYQEIILLSEKYLNLYPNLTPAERERNLELLTWLVAKLYAVTMGYSGLAFQGSFVSKLIYGYIDKLEQRKSNSSIDSQSIFHENQLTEQRPLIVRLTSATKTLSELPSQQNGSMEPRNIELFHDFEPSKSENKSTPLVKEIPIVRSGSKTVVKQN